MPDIPKGFDTSSCSETTLPIGSAVTGCGLCKIWGFEGQFRGRDLKRLWMSACCAYSLARTTIRMCVIGLVIPSVMLYPYRCSWMNQHLHNTHIYQRFTLYVQFMLHVRIDPLD